MRNRNIFEGRCGHRPLQTAAENRRILRADRVLRPYKWYEKPRRSCKKSPHFPFRNVGVDAYIDPPKASVFWWFSGESVSVFISRRRGGRLCPPAGIVRFYGNPMRNRNIFEGRCRHRPLQTAAENRRILREDRVVRPYKWYEKPRRSCKKSPHFPFRNVGVDAYIDPPKASVFWWFSGESVSVFISRRRGGRLCPPAGIVRFYGNPMRNRNIFEGRCRHRPLQTAAENRRILREDRVVRPSKGDLKITAPRHSAAAPGAARHTAAAPSSRPSRTARRSPRRRRCRRRPRAPRRGR